MELGDLFHFLLPGKPGNPWDPGVPGGPGGPGIALHGPAKGKECLTHKIMAECEAMYTERTTGVQVIFVFCPAWNVTLILNKVISQSYAKIFTHKIWTTHKRSQKELTVKGATRWKCDYTSYLLHPPVLHLLLDYSHLSVIIEREWKREAFGTRLFISTSIISTKHRCGWFEGCGLFVMVTARDKESICTHTKYNMDLT